MPNKLKELVSKNKRRYQADGFDLDLAYINERIIAMGFPAENLEGVYRNHLEDVQRFLELKHGNHYKIYNLCLEREYLPTKFKGEVTKYPFKDHNPPPLTLMMQFCGDVEEWLEKDQANVAVIHCKAGKGRTGVMICAYLIYSEKISPERALDLYAMKRTKDSKGVTIPSQRRYVHYFSHHLLLQKEMPEYEATNLSLTAFKFSSIPHFSAAHNCNIYFTIQEGFSVRRFDTVEAAKKGDTNVIIEVNQPCRGDIKIDFYCKSMIGKEKMFHFWFNTFFVRSQETTNLDRFSKISSKKAQDSNSVSHLPTSQGVTGNQNNTQKRSSLTRTTPFNPASHCFSYADSDLKSRTDIYYTSDGKNKLKPEVKNELIMKALMIMQKKHQAHQLADDLVDRTQGQVLTSFKSLDSSFDNAPRHLPDENIYQLSANRRSPSNPKLCPHPNKSSKGDLSRSCEAAFLDTPAALYNTYKTLVLTKSDLDKACKDKQHKIFPHDFTLTLYFSSCEGDYDQNVDAIAMNDNDDDVDVPSDYDDDDDAYRISV